MNAEIIIGIDEVGRGSFAGPIIACAAAFPADPSCANRIRDSKKIPKHEIYEIAKILMREIYWAIGARSAQFINANGIGVANVEAIADAARKIIARIGDCGNAKIIIDGWIKIDGLPAGIAQISIPRADSLVREVAAASIIAKYFRDQIMNKLDEKFPEYKFRANAGYGTAAHIRAIQECGIVDYLHRRQFIKCKYPQIRSANARSEDNNGNPFEQRGLF